MPFYGAPSCCGVFRRRDQHHLYSSQPPPPPSQFIQCPYGGEVLESNGWEIECGGNDDDVKRRCSQSAQSPISHLT
ncbi:hypothetical protein ANCDUO_12842 [Ancylostoma duodenale]|uniref:Uncharacterized protein n=1 Tax=Ancylostoma duodenale TaxID=51022 RepID=A0A0C2CKG5_9BILA|nr:hypothetical protein ANCDUO_12842 [Ancylostoma duodenale]